jgi:hypothetical protein
MSLTQVLLNTKVKDLPENFHVTVAVDEYYEVMIITERRVSITVNKKKGAGRDTHLVVYDPDPELTIVQIYQKARALIEEIVYKK